MSREPYRGRQAARDRPFNPVSPPGGAWAERCPLTSRTARTSSDPATYCPRLGHHTATVSLRPPDHPVISCWRTTLSRPHRDSGTAPAPSRLAASRQPENARGECREYQHDTDEHPGAFGRSADQFADYQHGSRTRRINPLYQSHHTEVECRATRGLTDVGARQGQRRPVHLGWPSK